MNSPISDSMETEYASIPIETICIDTAPAFDLYMRNQADKYVLFIARHTTVSQEKLSQFIRRGRRILYISNIDQKTYNNYVGDNLDKVLNDPITPKDQKASIVYNTAANLMTEVLEHPDSKENIRRAGEIARHTVSLVSSADTVDNILAMTAFDYSTHTHSVNVCVYGLSLAHHIGMTDANSLKDLGTGLLLHDVGKAKVNQDILHKPGRLTAEEFTHIKQHAAFGEAILQNRENVTEVSVQIAAQHHERIDGKGYPRGLQGEEIHTFARLAAILDVFDALTTRRPYKDPMPTFEALSIMKADEGHHDANMLRSFIQMLVSGTKFA